jgi:hypothetical protein
MAECFTRANGAQELFHFVWNVLGAQAQTTSLPSDTQAQDPRPLTVLLLSTLFHPYTHLYFLPSWSPSGATNS